MSDWKETTLGLIPSDWEIKTIGDIAELRQGLQISTSQRFSEYKEGRFPLLKITDLPSGNYAEYVESVPQNYIADKNDIIYTRTGQVGLVYTDKEGVVHNNCFKVITKKEFFDKYFIYYYLQSQNVKKYALSVASGSVQADLTHSAFKTCPIAFPTSLKEQKNIGSLLYNLDAKIENLRRQNETLEAIAQTLFKHWFIDFEFPNADGKPYKSSGGEMWRSELGDIPEGWQVLTLEKICKTIYRYPQFYGMEKVESGVPVIRGEHLLKTGRISVDFSDYWFVKDEYSAKFSKTILEEFDVVLSVRGSVGNYSVVGKKHIHAQISPNTIRLSANPKIIRKFLLYPCLKVNQFKQKLLSIVSSSAVPAINAFEFKTFEFAIPEMLVQDKLSDVFKDLYKKVDINEHQLETLTKTRDALLPKLMSGQLRVKE